MKVKYYLDETDQIEVDGHILSRLYLAENQNMVTMVKVYEKTNSLRIIADEEMVKLSPELYDDIVRGLLNPRNKNKAYYSEYSYY